MTALDEWNQAEQNQFQPWLILGLGKKKAKFKLGIAVGLQFAIPEISSRKSKISPDLAA